MTASITLNPSADIAAIVAALPNAGEHYYSAGRLYVEGVKQSKLDAAVAGRDMDADALNQAKRAKLAEMNAAAGQSVRDLASLDAYPEFERQTWPMQQAEAAAWFATPDTERTAALAPWCAAAATQRGRDLGGFMVKVQAKAAAFQALSAAISGQRQALEDQIEAAQTLADVQAIVWELPT